MFTQGLNMSLLTNRHYALEGPSSMRIPYSIQCLGCDDFVLVDEGVVMNQATHVPGIDATHLTFKLNVGFDEIDLETLETGHYQDTIVFVFEPNI